MCGIFGIVVPAGSDLAARDLRKAVDCLFHLSESRGKEASGLAFLAGADIRVYKNDVPASTLVRTAEYDRLFQSLTETEGAGNAVPNVSYPVAVIGHSRLVTTGAQEVHHNNQPVVKDGIVGIHNGIIVNFQDLWSKFTDIDQQFDLDSEVIFSLIRKFLSEEGSLTRATRQTFDAIEGVASIAGIFADLDQVLLATNNGSLYLLVGPEGQPLLFASERYILDRFLIRRPFEKRYEGHQIVRIEPGEGCIVNLEDTHCSHFGWALSAPPVEVSVANGSTRRISEINSGNQPIPSPPHSVPSIPTCDFSVLEKKYPYDLDLVDSIRRCSKCVMPYTMPYIEFDEDGVCNYCRRYRKRTPKAESIFEIAERRRSPDGKIDCLVGMSGGRDSCYALHYVKSVLKLNPAAFTYDWGMVTDLARRNISRICGKLGVEHILVSADINRKRSYIKKNVEAWLKRPELGMIPLFMAGDKHYFYYANKVRNQLGVKLIIFGENMLEKMDFKAGFAWVKPADIDEDHVYSLSLANKVRMLSYYGTHSLRNPRYLNSSILDTFVGYMCYYVIGRDYENIFRYIGWDEETVVSTIRDLYDWEVAEDTSATWRIGDGTASFYNYAYFTIAGFSEMDGLRSNQIREGVLGRDEAMRLIREENRPRLESIKWYVDTIKLGMPFEEVLRIINSVPKLYSAG